MTNTLKSANTQTEFNVNFMTVDLFQISNELGSLLRELLKQTQPASVIGTVQGVRFYVELFYQTKEPPSQETLKSWIDLGLEDESILEEPFEAETTLSNWHGFIYPKSSTPVRIEMLDGFPKQRHMRYKSQRKLFNPATWLSRPTFEVSFGEPGFTHPKTGEFIQTHFRVDTPLQGTIESPLEPVLSL